MKKFIDECSITVSSGNGGRGEVSFRREKYVPKGGPDGGDGGRGGDIIFVADAHVKTLYDIRRAGTFRAGNGQPGRGRNRSGERGADCVITVPVGTVLRDRGETAVLCDFDHDGMEYVAARGGLGGQGNQHFATSVNQAPRYAQPGLPGLELELDLELKIIADVGLVGFPNAGKSTLLKALTRANPKIAAYPFTTLNPNLGVVHQPPRLPFVIADIPGIIEGAAEGKGLGIEFLKHIERTRILLIVVDLFTDEPEETRRVLLHELEQFSPRMLDKPMLLVGNKTDLPEARERAAAHPGFIPVSAATHQGLDPLLARIYETLARTAPEEGTAP